MCIADPEDKDDQAKQKIEGPPKRTKKQKKQNVQDETGMSHLQSQVPL